jgi:PIN domain nuclease of toxin-antitoxin system
MRYLIDSNILIYYIADNEQLTAEVKDILTDYGNQIYVPSRCVEELIHLRQCGRINVKGWKSAEDIVDFITDDLQFGIKHTGDDHLRTLARLPMLSDHKDPTDRIAIAQAITEGTRIISSDRKFQDYRRFGLEFIYNKR